MTSSAGWIANDAVDVWGGHLHHKIDHLVWRKKLLVICLVKGILNQLFVCDTPDIKISVL